MFDLMEKIFRSKAFDTALDYCNYVFTSVFVLEAISKIIALGPLRYFKDR